jgi:hypothetical protein
MAVMMKSVLFAAAVAALATPAAATEWIYCNDATNTVTAGLLLGSEPMAVAGIILSLDERVWASAAAYGPGEPIGIGQGFENDMLFFADFVDGQSVKIAELRLTKASEGESYVSAGTLRILGAGAWAVACEGP